MNQFVRPVTRQVSLTDVLQYVVPGGSLIAWLFLADLWAEKSPVRGVRTPIWKTFELLKDSVFTSDWAVAVLGSVVLVALCYVLGHLLATLGSFFIDRVIVLKGYGYPYQSLLGIDRPNRWRSTSFKYYRSLFFWFNVAVITCYFRELVPGHIPWWLVLPIDVLFWASLTALLVPLAAKLGIRALTTEGERAAPPGAPLPPEAVDPRMSLTWMKAQLRAHLRYNYLDDKRRNAAYNRRHVLIAAFSAPYDYLSWFLHGYFNTRAPFDPRFAGKYKRLFRRAFGLNADSAGTHNFWFTYLHLASCDQAVWGQIERWRVLSDFSRNLAVSFYLAFLWSFAWLASSPLALRPFHSGNATVLLFLPLAAYVLSMLLLLRFYYFYYAYFGKALFRAFVWLESSRRIRRPAVAA